MYNFYILLLFALGAYLKINIKWKHVIVGFNYESNRKVITLNPYVAYKFIRGSKKNTNVLYILFCLTSYISLLFGKQENDHFLDINVNLLYFVSK